MNRQSTVKGVLEQTPIPSKDIESIGAGEAEKYSDGDYLVDEAHCPEVAPRFTDLAMSLPFKGLGADQISFLELASQANYLKLTFEAGTTPAEVATVLKKFLNVVVKEGHASQTFPGVIVKKCKSNGKTFPSGLIQGGCAAVHPDALKCLAIPFLRGRDHRLSQWKVPFVSF